MIPPSTGPRVDSANSQNNNSKAKAHGGAKNGVTSWRTRFKQAACAALLASPGSATAARLGSAGLPRPQAGNPRHLLADTLGLCPTNAVDGPYGEVIPPYGLSNHSLAVLGDTQWYQAVCRNGSAQSIQLNSSSIPITYTFGPSIPVNASDKVGTAAENFAIMDLSLVSQVVGIQTKRVDFETGVTPTVPNLAFGVSSKAGHHPWETTGLAPLLQVTSDIQSHVFIYAYDQNNQDFAWRLSAVGQGLGLKGRGQPGYGGNSDYDIGDFSGDTLSSVTFSDIALCANVTRMGALDLRALVDVYGFANGAKGNATLTVDDNFGAGGIIASTDLNNTLVASTRSNRAVQIILTDDGRFDTFVGNSVARLAPGSVISHVDINGTNGGLILGNNYANTFIGSAQNDTFGLGAGQSNITFNGGFDKAVFLYNTSVGYLKDFNANHTLWFSSVNTPKPAVKVQAWGTLGTQVSLPNGPTAYLANFTAAKFDPSRSVFGGEPQVTATSPSPVDIVNCTSNLMKLNLPDPQSSQPSFNPCDHIGQPGFGGPSVAACTHPVG